MTGNVATLFDPLQLAFGGGQQLYRGALLSIINGRRMLLGRPPVGWPAVGSTARDAMWSEGAACLWRYRPQPGAGASRGGAPLLLCCSLINRPYILDLFEERSVVRRLLEAGIDVWLLDWGDPRPADAEHGLAHYALGVLPRAAAAVAAATRSERVDLLGYCMGGTFALCAAAAGRLPPRRLVALATPVDLDEGGTLTTWCRSPELDAAAIARAHGNVPPYLLSPAFKMLDPVGLATKLVHLQDKLGDDAFLRFFLAMETWLEDSVAFPGRAFADWVAVYRDNALARGTLTLDGAAIDLRRVTAPILNIVAESDYITPPASSVAIEQLAGSRAYRVVRMSGGHIGLSTGGAAHRTLWPEVAAWLRQIMVGVLSNLLRRYLGTKGRDIRLERELAGELDHSSQAIDRGFADPGPTPSKLAAGRERAVLLADALGRLPDDYREAIILRNLEELPFAEVAKRMGRSEDAVQKLWIRALAKLRTALDGEDQP